MSLSSGVYAFVWVTWVTVNILTIFKRKNWKKWKKNSYRSTFVLTVDEIDDGSNCYGWWWKIKRAKFKYFKFKISLKNWHLISSHRSIKTQQMFVRKHNKQIRRKARAINTHDEKKNRIILRKINNKTSVERWKIGNGCWIFKCIYIYLSFFIYSD